MCFAIHKIERPLKQYILYYIDSIQNPPSSLKNTLTGWMWHAWEKKRFIWEWDFFIYLTKQPYRKFTDAHTCMLSAVITQVEADTSVWSVSTKHTHNTAYQKLVHTQSWLHGVAPLFSISGLDKAQINVLLCRLSNPFFYLWNLPKAISIIFISFFVENIQMPTDFPLISCFHAYLPSLKRLR